MFLYFACICGAHDFENLTNALLSSNFRLLLGYAVFVIVDTMYVLRKHENDCWMLDAFLLG